MLQSFRQRVTKDPADAPPRPARSIRPQDPLVRQDRCDLRHRPAAFDEHLENAPYSLRPLSRSRDKAQGLKRMRAELAAPQNRSVRAVSFDYLPIHQIPGPCPRSASRLRSPPLSPACPVRNLPDIVRRHHALDLLDELPRRSDHHEIAAVGYRDAVASADELVVSRLVRVLKAAPSTDVENQNAGEVRPSRDHVEKKPAQT
ncbi:hypothetical protein D3C80_1222510 [compost metagenome]